MKKVIFLFVLAFLVFGILLHAPLVFADKGKSTDNKGSDSNSSSNSIKDNSRNSEDSDENETEREDDKNKSRVREKTREDDDENETEREDDKNKSRVREKTREETREGNCTIRIERELKIEDGKRVESVKRKIECADGTKTEIKIRIENRTEDGRVRERVRYEIKGEEIEVEAEDEIKFEEETNETEYRLKARLKDGNVTRIKIMPHQASEIALKRLRALNFTVELREVTDDRNIPHVVYNIKTNKHGRFLGVFKLSMKIEGQVDPETGEFIGISKPWWAFLVAGEDSDETGDEDEDETGENETDTNETEIDEIMINLTRQNDSGEFGTATLTEEDGQVIVTLNLVGVPQNVSQPAHIHNGSCPDVGGVKYPLTNVLNGESETTINVTFDQLEDELPLAINVHRSVENASVYVACGDIEF
jgi:hypothetical protein